MGKTAELRFRPVVSGAVPVQGHADDLEHVVDVEHDRHLVDDGDVVHDRRDRRAGQERPRPCAGRLDHLDDGASTDAAHDRDDRRDHRHVRGDPPTTAPATAPGIPPLSTPAQDQRNATVVLCDRDGKLRLRARPDRAHRQARHVRQRPVQRRGGSGWVVVIVVQRRRQGEVQPRSPRPRTARRRRRTRWRSCSTAWCSRRRRSRRRASTRRRRDLGELQPGRRRGPRDGAEVRLAAGPAEGAHHHERVADPRSRPARRRAARRCDRPRARRALHARLLPAARPRGARRPRAVGHGDLHDDHLPR